MLRKTSGLEVTIDVIDTICVTYDTIQPPDVPSIEEPAWPFGEPPFDPPEHLWVVNNPVDGAPVVIQENPPAAAFANPSNVAFQEVQYFDPIQERVVQKFVPCRPSFFDAGGGDVYTPLTEVTYLSPGGCA